MWGVQTTLSSREQRIARIVQRLLLVDVDGRHARAAPRAAPSTSAPGSIRPARLVFTSRAVGFMRARSAALTMPRVASTSRRCSETTSPVSKNACLLGATSHPSARARSRDVSRDHTSTFMPNARP